MPSASDTPAARPARIGGHDVGTLAAVVVLAAAVVLFPKLAPNPYILSVGVTIISYAVLSTSWNFVGGFTGYISLGHAAYSGVGGYATALLITRRDVNPWLALVLGAVIVAVLSIPVGIAALRVRGASFVIVSIALVLILLLVFQAWGSFTGGSNGLRVPRPFPPGVLRPAQHERFFYIHGIVLGVVLFVWWLFDRSRFGTGLKAIREDEDKAQALGVPTFMYKLVAFVTSAFFTAIGGGLYALWFGNLDPIFQFSILTGAYMVLMSLLGGLRSLFGPLLGAVVVGVALEYFKSEYGDSQFHLVAMGVLLAAIVLFMPDGIIPAAAGWIGRFRPQATSIREQTQADLAASRGEPSGSTSSTPSSSAHSDRAAVAP